MTIYGHTRTDKQREYDRRYYKEHREKILKRSIDNMRRYRAENREWLRESKRKYDLRYCAINKERIAKKFHEYHLRYRKIWMEIIHVRGMDRCSRCGYDKCFPAIDFHHKNRKEKKVQYRQSSSAASYRRKIEGVRKNDSFVF